MAAPSFTRSFSSLLGLKNGIFFAGTSTRSPVFGLRPTRGLRWRVRKLPKPRISILSPARSERTTLSKIVSTITSLSFRVSSAKRETSSIRSALVIASLLSLLRLASQSRNIRVTRLGRPGLFPVISHNLLKFQGLDASYGVDARYLTTRTDAERLEISAIHGKSHESRSLSVVFAAVPRLVESHVVSGLQLNP